MPMNRLKNFLFVAGLMTVAGLFTPAVAEDSNVDSGTELFDMSIEELMDVEIVSASRQADSLFGSSVQVTTVTADKIHLSGQTNIPEILRFVPGIDVGRIDRNHYSVGIRGLSSAVSNRVLVLINGRSINDAAFDTTDWTGYPIFMEDIKRIEVLRGPVSSSWGSNAMTGVINIITKDPGKLPTWFISSHVNEYGDSYNHIRYAGATDNFSWRNSFGYESWKAYPDSKMEVNQLGWSGSSFVYDDFSNVFKTDNEFRYTISDQTEFKFGGSYSDVKSGSYELLNYSFQDDAVVSNAGLFAWLD